MRPGWRSGHRAPAQVTLRGVKPPIWRRVLVPSEDTLAESHQVLLIAMGWAGYHVYAIRVGDTSYEEEDDDGEVDAENAASAWLGDVVGVGDRFVDEYDFGDGWKHEVVVEAVEPAAGRTAPVCLDGRRACPPEDVGGTSGYAEFVDAVRDPNHERHSELLKWYGGPFHADTFDAAAVNDALAHRG